MACVIDATARVRASGEAPTVASLLRADHQWSCSESSADPAAYAAVAEIDAAISRDDYVAARRVGETAQGRLGAACPIVVESAVATLALAALGDSTVSPVQFERALRTVVTADIEMGLPWSGGAREWPYQLAALTFIGRHDGASALVMVRLAQARMQERKSAGADVRPAAEQQLQRLLERATAELNP
ncbi:MAG TPA: hypothetical protein VFN10_24015 [Thermoanaerobaculia bacterium]|nr:hypothetical protein [Thermoanaerobaculia bacterium]